MFAIYGSLELFLFNCYHHHSSLVLRNVDGTANIMHIREIVTQGCPLAVVAYVIVFLLIIKHLKESYPDFAQPWYADYDGALGTFDNVKLYFNSLKRIVPARGYYPDPTKIILIVHPENPKARKLFFVRCGFKVCTGARYLGGYIRDDKSKRSWLKDWMDKWEINIYVITKMVGKYPQ